MGCVLQLLAPGTSIADNAAVGLCRRVRRARSEQVRYLLRPKGRRFRQRCGIEAPLSRFSGFLQPTGRPPRSLRGRTGRVPPSNMDRADDLGVFPEAARRAREPACDPRFSLLPPEPRQPETRRERRLVDTVLLRRDRRWGSIPIVRPYIEQQKTPHGKLEAGTATPSGLTFPASNGGSCRPPGQGETGLMPPPNSPPLRIVLPLSVFRGVGAAVIVAFAVIPRLV